MKEIAATIIFFSSILGMIIIIFRKIPILVGLPEVSLLPAKEGLISKFGKRVKRILPFKNFSYELFLQKILAKIRILVLKIENLTFHWLQKLRESHQRKNAPKLDDYWEKIRQEIKKLKK